MVRGEPQPLYRSLHRSTRPAPPFPSLPPTPRHLAPAPARERGPRGPASARYHRPDHPSSRPTGFRGRGTLPVVGPRTAPAPAPPRGPRGRSLNKPPVTGDALHEIAAPVKDFKATVVTVATLAHVVLRAPWEEQSVSSVSLSVPSQRVTQAQERTIEQPARWLTRSNFSQTAAPKSIPARAARRSR